jgi:hypothetical protein
MVESVTKPEASTRKLTVTVPSWPAAMSACGYCGFLQLEKSATADRVRPAVALATGPIYLDPRLT